MPDKNRVMKASDVIMGFSLSKGGRRMTMIEGDNFFMITIEAFKSCQDGQVKQLIFTPAGTLPLGEAGEEKDFNAFTCESEGHLLDKHYEKNLLKIDKELKNLTL